MSTRVVGTDNSNDIGVVVFYGVVALIVYAAYIALQWIGWVQ